MDQSLVDNTLSRTHRPRSLTSGPTISVQLHSLASQASTDLVDTLFRLKTIGYEAVEPVRRGRMSQATVDFFRRMVGKEFDSLFLPEPGIRDLRDALDLTGMAVSGCHVWLPDDPKDFGPILDEQQVLGNKKLVVPGIIDHERGRAEDFSDMERIKRLAQTFNNLADQARSNGMKIGYHNHWEEFSTDFDGRSGLELFFDLVDPEVFAELDVYWVHAAGRDPVELIQTLGARVELIHVKDGSGEPGQLNTAVGRGALDIPAILAAARNVSAYTVEFDRIDDVWPALAESYSYIAEHAPDNQP